MAAEVNRATLAETILQTNIDTEISLRIAADLTLTTDLNNESARALAAETILSNDLVAEITRATNAENAEAIARANADTNESIARIAGDIVNADAISAEEQARIAGDIVNASSIETETYRAIAAETILSNDLVAEITRAGLAETVLSNSITDEATARVAGDLTNANAINAETNRATSAENTISTNLTSEVNRAISAENTLTSNLTAEVNRATAAENTLTTNILAEETARIVADTNLQNQIDFIVSNIDPVALDSLTEIVSAFQNADNDINGAITYLGATLQDNIDAEETARIADVATLTNNLSAEVNRATAAENTLTANLSAEVNRAISAENTLTSNLTAEVNRATAAENTLTINLANEIIRATNAENAEAIARANAINNEANIRRAGDEANADAIAAEAIARNQADINIGQRIDNLTTDDIAEGTNLYYTTARANADFDTRLATKTTTDLTEGTNLYYTDLRARNAISVEGTLHYDSINGIISTFGGDVPNEVRLGSSAGLVNQGTNAVAIGRNAGNTNQGNYSIAIGAFAGNSGQANNSIVLSAVTPGPGWDNLGDDWDELPWDEITTALNPQTAGFFVKPVRNVNTTNPVYYDPITGEISYGEFPDFALTSYVDAADNNLQNQINFILNNTNPAALDSLTEIVSAFQAADNSLNGAITLIGSTLQVNINAESASRIADDNALRNSLTSEEAARIAGDAATRDYVDSQISSTLAATHSGYYTHTQSVESIEWIINHNLGARFVDIEIIDADGTAYDGRFDYPTISFEDPDYAVITFTEPLAGWAVVSHGVAVIGDVTELANVAVTGSYLDLRDAPPLSTRTGTHTHTQDVAEIQWIISHGLGTRFVDVEIIDDTGTAYDGRFDYPTITFVDADTLTVTFTEAQAGWAVISHGVTVMKNVTELAHVAVSGSYLDLRDTPESGASTWSDITFDGGTDYIDTDTDNYGNSEVILEAENLDAPVAGAAPATSSSTGVPGQIAYDNNYVYVCVATNTWKRSPLTSW